MQLVPAKVWTALFISATLLTSALNCHSQPQPGTVLWSFTSTNGIASSPALAPDGTIYLATQGALYAITDADSSASNKWIFPAITQGSPAVGHDGTIYFGGGGFFYAVNPDGSQKWRVAVDLSCDSSPAIGWDDTTYFISGGELYAVDAGGTVKWKYPIGDSSDYATVSPVIGGDGTIYAGGGFGPLFAMNPNGTVKWSVNPNAGGPYSESPAVGADGTIYVAFGDLYAYSPAGVQLWQTTGLFIRGTTLVGADGTIYTSDDSGMYAFGASGAVKWHALNVPYWHTPPPATPALAAGGTIYYCTSNNLFCLSAAQGAVQWVSPGFQLQFNQMTSPTIAPDGTIYAALMDTWSTLYAFAGTNRLADSPWPMYRQNPRHTGKVERPTLQARRRTGPGFAFQLYGQVGDSFTIQTSTNLEAWTSLTNFVATTVPMDLVDSTATNFPIRFYRATSP